MQFSEILAIASLRLDGRRFNELRKIKYKIGVDNSVDGSTYLEQGLNKVLVLIQGPIEGKLSEGIIQCTINNTAFSGTDHKIKKSMDRRNQEMENIIKETFESVIMEELYPNSIINIVIHILESDGSIICTIINAITLALLEAGISMIDMIVSCSIGYIHNQIYLDVTSYEQNSGVYIPVVLTSKKKEIIYFQVDNRITLNYLQLALNEIQLKCNEIIILIELAIKELMNESLKLQNKLI